MLFIDSEKLEVVNQVEVTEQVIEEVSAQHVAEVMTVEHAVEIEKPKAKYIEKREKRTKFSFGKVWCNNVLAGKVNDKPKLVAHAVKLGVGSELDMDQLDFSDLLLKVQEALVLEIADIKVENGDSAPEVEQLQEQKEIETEAQKPDDENFSLVG